MKTRVKIISDTSASVYHKDDTGYVDGYVCKNNVSNETSIRAIVVLDRNRTIQEIPLDNIEAIPQEEICYIGPK